MATHKILAGLKNDVAEALQFHIEGCIADGDKLPEWAVSGNYEVEYNLSVKGFAMRQVH